MNTVTEPLALAAAQTPLTFRVVRDFAALEARRAEWNALVARAQTGTIFQTWELHASWWKALGGCAQLCVVLAESGGGLVGIAPLMLRERRMLGMRRRVVEFIGARALDYTDFIVDASRPDVLPSLVREVAARIECDLLYLRDIPAASETVDALRAAFGTRGTLDVRELYQAPTRLFNDPVADRQLPNKKSLKRHYNHYAKSGRLEFHNLRSAEEIRPYLETFFEQHVGRRASTDAPSLFLDPANRRFFRELVGLLAPTGRLLFSVVAFEGKPIAMHLGFEYEGCITWYKPAFDMSHAKHSPGEVLMKFLFEYALQSKASELDFTIGEEAFKYRFANHMRANCAVRVYRSRLAYTLGRLIMNARRRIERHPAGTRILRRLFAGQRGGVWS